MGKTVAALTFVFVIMGAALPFAANLVSGADVAENTWTTKAPMNVARSDLGVAAVNGKIYAIGGNAEAGYMPNSEGNDYKALGWIKDTNEEYDPATDTWKIKTPMPTPRCNFAIATLANKIYCIGGITNWASGLISYTAVNEVYDPATNTWENKAPMPTPASAQAAAVNGRIYVIGGGSNETLNQVYDPATDTWTTKKPMPVEPQFLGPNALSTLVSAEVDGKIYIMTYYTPMPSGTWVYNPARDNWASLSSSPFTLLNGPSWWSHAAAATSGVNAAKRIYVFFERYPYSAAPPYLTLDPSSGGWTRIGELTVKRRCFGVAVVNDVLYVIGGRTYDYPFPGDGYFTVTEQAVTQQYTPIDYGTPDPSYDGTAPIIGLVSPENKTYYESKLPLNFTVDDPDCWLSYELDGGAPVDVSGNTTLSGLSFGSHNLTLYAIDGVGNTANQSTIFTLAEPETPSEPFPVVPVAVIVVIVVAVGGAGLLLYYRRHRKGSGRR